MVVNDERIAAGDKAVAAKKEDFREDITPAEPGCPEGAICSCCGGMFALKSIVMFDISAWTEGPIRSAFVSAIINTKIFARPADILRGQLDRRTATSAQRGRRR